MQLMKKKWYVCRQGINMFDEISLIPSSCKPNINLSSVIVKSFDLQPIRYLQCLGHGHEICDASVGLTCVPCLYLKI